MITINGVRWKVLLVSPFHTKLFRRNGSRSVGVCDNYTKTIYISWDLNQNEIERVLKHELFHAILFSNNVQIDLDVEERLAGWIEEKQGSLF